MNGFIPYEKLSKKKKREHDAIKRATWGGLSPTTRKSPSAKAYDRKKTRRRMDEHPGSGSFYIRFTYPETILQATNTFATHPGCFYSPLCTAQ